MNILIVGPTWVGDTVLATPVLANLRSAFPAAKIHCLSTAWAGDILIDHPDVDELRLRPGGAAADFRAAAAFRRDRMDLAFVLPNSIRGALLALAAGARRRVGYRRDGRSILLTDPVPRLPPPRGGGRHQVDEYLALLEAAGVSVTSRIPRVGVSREAETFAGEVFLRHGIDPDEPVVGIQPGAKFGATKLWPAERFAAAADGLAESEGARIVLLGSPAEGPLTARIASLMKTAPVDLAGKDRVAFLPALLRRFSVLLTEDTGPMHIAAAVGTPVVALFGPTDPGRTGPLGDRHTVLRRDLSCAPCFLKQCPYGHECMEETAVDGVYRAVRETLRASASSRAGAGASHG